jgi:hypothetical protein
VLCIIHHLILFVKWYLKRSSTTALNLPLAWDNLLRHKGIFNTVVRLPYSEVVFFEEIDNQLRKKMKVVLKIDTGRNGQQKDQPKAFWSFCIWVSFRRLAISPSMLKI